MTWVITGVVDCGDGVCIGGKHLLTTNHSPHHDQHRTEPRSTEANQRGLLSTREVFDFWVDVVLGDTIDDITSNSRKADKVYE